MRPASRKASSSGRLPAASSWRRRLIITEAEIAELGRRLRAALDRVLANHSLRQPIP